MSMWWSDATEAMKSNIPGSNGYDMKSPRMWSMSFGDWVRAKARLGS
jgi:hypothetical protein